MRSAEYWVTHLKLLPHPEGGFYKETYRSAEEIPPAALPNRFGGPRNFSTAIYFLLRATDKSLFHRIKSDEIWHYHAGDTLQIYVLTGTGLIIHRLGSHADLGDTLQVTIHANHWFGALVSQNGQYTLSGCTVAPGFDFQDFELGIRENLIRDFPGQEEIIKRLTP
jgi:predicted cupin superfamily sugar epimerase